MRTVSRLHLLTKWKDVEKEENKCTSVLSGIGGRKDQKEVKKEEKRRWKRKRRWKQRKRKRRRIRKEKT